MTFEMLKKLYFFIFEIFIKMLYYDFYIYFRK